MKALFENSLFVRLLMCLRAWYHATFRYELIDAMAETQDYMILLMKKRYAQPLDKRTLTGGTVEECKRFLEEKTGKMFRRVK